jgi:hypothetical protein
MTAPLLLPVLASKKTPGWPRHSDAPKVDLIEAAEAFTRPWPTDAHFAAYSVPGIEHRLTLDAIGRLPEGWPMVLLVVDVDGPGHRREPAWWAEERLKLEALAAAHPGGFFYATRGGYRVVYRLAFPVVIRTVDDKEAWRERYRRELLYLARRFGIVGDPACSDLTRLFRLPKATRTPGGAPEDHPALGDPTQLGVWTHEPSAAELEEDASLARTLASMSPKAWGPVLRALEGGRGRQEGEAPAPELRPEDQDEERLHKRAAAYLARMSPSIEGAGGNAALWEAALAMVRGFSLGPSTASALLLRDFNPRCVPPWPRAEVERACRNAAERGEKPWGWLRDAEGGDAGLLHKPGERRSRTAAPARAGFSPRQTAPEDRANEAPMHDHAHDQDDDTPASGPRPAPRDERPEIRMSADLPGNIDAAVKALAKYPNLYTRALSLAQIVDTTDPEAHDRKGAPVLRPLPRPTLREMLVKVASWMRFEPRSEGWKEAIPSDAIVQGVESRGYWPELRPIVGIVQTPFLRRDGTICERPGYDDATGFALVCRDTFPPVPEAPTQDDARRALASILDLFCDFPFIDEAARHVPVAALLTMLAMPALGGANTPAFLFEANTPGTGKGLTLDTVCILATGREVPKSPWAHDEEMAKVLGAAALEGASVLAFDNISPEIPFGGAAIELVLTCSGQYKPRILGRSESPTLPWRAVVMGTGNNIVVRGDTRRRVLLCTQRSELENPETRDGFKYPHLRQEARARRSELVTAALTILRAHALAGRPAAGVRRLGSFEEWGSMVASAIAWAGGANVVDAMPKNNTSDDPVLSALRVLLEAWPLFDPVASGLRLGALADKLYPPRRQGEPDEADGLGHVREALELLAPARGGGPVRFDVRRLGYVLRAHRGRNLGGRAFEEGPVNHGAKTWRVVDPSTGLGVRHDDAVMTRSVGGSEGSGGSFSCHAGAPRASAPAPAFPRAHAGSAPGGLQSSPTSPTSTRPGSEPDSSVTPPPVSGVTSDPDEGGRFYVGPDGLGVIEA